LRRVFHGRPVRPLLRIGLLGTLLLVSCRDDPETTVPTTPEPTGDTGGPCADAPEWPEAQGFVRTWCLPCHSDEVVGTDRQGAPVGVDFDTYAQVFAWREAIAQRATGPDLDMPPVPGASDQAVARFAEWLACGAEGTDTPPVACDDLTPATGAPSAILSDDDADAFCAAGNQAPGDLEVHVDVDCLCDVQGDLITHGGALPLLASVAGSLHLEAGATALPSLHTVGGSVTTDAPSTVPLGALQAVGGDLLVDGGTPTEVDLAELLTVDGRLVVADLSAVERVDLSRLRVVGGSLRLSALPALTELEGLMAVESVGRGPVEVGGTPTGADQGGVELSGLGQVSTLRAFRLVTAVGGPIQVIGNPALADIDVFTTLPQLSYAVRISDNPSLAALEGFDTLETAGDVEVLDNIALANIFGFTNLREADVVAVEGSPNLRSLLGLSALEHVGGLRLLGLALQDIPWFTELHTVDGELVVSNQPILGRVSGLTALTSVGGDLRFRLNPVILEVQGSGALTEVGGSVAFDTMEDLRDAPLLSGLVSVGADLRIVETNLADLDDLGVVDAVGGDLVITGNPSLPSADAQALADRVTVDGDVIVSDNGP